VAGEHALTVEPEEAGERLDLFLHRRLPELSRSALKRLIEDGLVRIDGRAPKASRMLRAGELVELRVPPPPPPLPVPQEIPFDLLHEDASFLVIGKPAGLVVHPGAGNVTGGTLVNALLARTDRLSREAGDFRPGIVHRLDRETSGLMVIARDDDTHRRIAAQFKARMVRKEYLALAHGIPAAPEGRVAEPIGRSLTDRKRMAVRHDSGGKPAITAWRAVGTLGELTWFRCFPHTGRTHQIRVHLKSIGHPILCDFVYGRERTITLSQARGHRPQGKEAPVLARHALHALRLAFRHPEDGRPLAFEAPLPADLATLWAASRIDARALASPAPPPPAPEELARLGLPPEGEDTETAGDGGEEEA